MFYNACGSQIYKSHSCNMSRIVELCNCAQAYLLKKGNDSWVLVCCVLQMTHNKNIFFLAKTKCIVISDIHHILFKVYLANIHECANQGVIGTIWQALFSVLSGMPWLVSAHKELRSLSWKVVSVFPSQKFLTLDSKCLSVRIDH